MSSIIRGTDNVDSANIAETTGTLLDTALMKYDAASGKLVSTGIQIDSTNNHATIGRSTGNLPFGGANSRTLQIGDGSSILQFEGSTVSYIYNASYFDGVNSIRQTSSVIPTRYTISNGNISYENAPIDAAGSVISPWNSIFGVNSSGNVYTKGNIISGYTQDGTHTGAQGQQIIAYAGDSNNYTQIQARNTSGGSNAVFYSMTGGIRRAAIMDNGTYQSATNVYGSTSDIKLKENVVDTTPKLDKLMQVQVRNFNYIGAEEKQIGVIAQEIEQIFPGVVYETEDEVLTEVAKTREITLEDGTITTEEYLTEEMQPNGEFTKNVKYSVIYMMMLKGMQELNAKVDAQKQEIDELRKMIIDMKGAI